MTTEPPSSQSLLTYLYFFFGTAILGLVSAYNLFQEEIFDVFELLAIALLSSAFTLLLVSFHREWSGTKTIVLLMLNGVFVFLLGKMTFSLFPTNSSDLPKVMTTMYAVVFYGCTGGFMALLILGRNSEEDTK